VGVKPIGLRVRCNRLGLDDVLLIIFSTQGPMSHRRVDFLLEIKKELAFAVMIERMRPGARITGAVYLL
jgi:hypothetical protein